MDRNISNLSRLYDENKLKPFEEYKKLDKKGLLSALGSSRRVYGKLRILYEQVSLENYYLERRIKMLENRVKVLSHCKGQRSFKDIDKSLERIEERRDKKRRDREEKKCLN